MAFRQVATLIDAAIWRRRDVVRFIFQPACPARATHDLTWRGAGVLAIFQHLHAVNQNVRNASGILMRLLESCEILNCLRIKNHDVRRKMAKNWISFGSDASAPATGGVFLESNVP